MFLGSFAKHTICFDANKLWKIPGTSFKERRISSVKYGSPQMEHTIRNKTSKTESICCVNHDQSEREPSDIFTMTNSRTCPSRYSDLTKSFQAQQGHRPYDVVNFENLPKKPTRRRCKYCERLCGLRSYRKDSYTTICQNERSNTATPTIPIYSGITARVKRYSTATSRMRSRASRDRDKKSHNVKEERGFSKISQFPISRNISPNSCQYCRKKREKETLGENKYHHVNTRAEILTYKCSKNAVCAGCRVLTSREYMSLNDDYRREKINYARSHCYPPSSRHKPINLLRLQTRTPRQMVVSLQPNTRPNSSAIVHSPQKIPYPRTVQTHGHRNTKGSMVDHYDKSGVRKPKDISAVPKTLLGSLTTLAASSIGYNTCWRCFGGSESDDSDYTTEDDGSDSGGGDSIQEVENAVALNLSNPSLAPSDMEDSSGGSGSGESSAVEQISSNSSIYNEEIMLQEAQANRDGEFSTDDDFDVNAGGYNIFDEQSITDSDEYFGDTDENDGIFYRNDRREIEVQAYSKSLSSVDIL